MTDYVFVGAGGLGRKIAAVIRPVCFADNDRAKHGTLIDGIPCMSLTQAVQRHQQATFVITIWGAYSPHRISLTESQLRGLYVTTIAPFGILLAEAGLSHYFFGRFRPSTAYYAAEYVWADDASRALFQAHVETRWDCRVNRLPEPGPELPYVPGHVYRAHPSGEVVLDGGAFDGDTLQQWVDAGVPFRHWLAVEPHPVSARRCRERVLHLAVPNVTTIEAALGTALGRTRFPRDASLSAAGSAEGEYAVRVEPVDRVADLAVPTLLKLDVEGAELDAIQGAKHTIQTHRPVVAACVYHTPSHLWEIPMLLKTFLPDARFYLRAHMAEGWDTVCYAVPPERAL